MGHAEKIGNFLWGNFWVSLFYGLGCYRNKENNCIILFFCLISADFEPYFTKIMVFSLKNTI